MPDPDPISSTKNPLVKNVRQIREGRVPGCLVAEGVRLVEEALAAGLEIRSSLVSSRLYQTERGQALAARLARAGESRDCTDEVLERASGLTTHQGALVVASVPQWSEEAFLTGSSPFLVVAAGVRDPGNLGALVRAAEAAGATGFLVMQGSADPFRDKAVRGSAGSVFRVPVRAALSGDEIAAFCARHGVTLVATDGQHGTPYWDLDLGRAPHAFVLGAEASGIPKPVREQCRHLLRIPMAEPVESLNVAVAAGVVLFDHRRRIETGGR